MLDMAFGSEIKGKTDFTLPESAAVTVVSSKPPEITTAGLNMRVAGETAVLGVLGKNLTNAQLFLRNDTDEIPMGADHWSDTELAVLDSALESTIKTGVWDVVVRTPEGEAVLPKAVTRPAK